MRTRASDEYISNRAWLRDIAADLPLILRGVSALEYLEFIDGCFGENEIYAYAENAGPYENIHYEIIDSFENIEYVKIGRVFCSTFNQAVNDMLSDRLSDDRAICEALSSYFYSNNKSFDGLLINKENSERFNGLADSAISYYRGG